MNKWIELPDEEKKIAYEQIGVLTGRSPFIIEKDWWVVQALSVVFELPVGRHLLFKGGTSLSKAWNLINRFSEDIDLAIDRDFLGFHGNLKKEQRSKLRKAAGEYASGPFLKDLQQAFKVRGFKGIKLEIEEAKNSDQDPRIINIYYPNLIEASGYIAPRVQVEIGCRSLREPYTVRTISSLVDEHYPDKEFIQSPIRIPSVDPERTFLEKLFLLHEEFQRPTEKIRVNRLSRHMYDIFKIANSPYGKKALQDLSLYETIVNHRYRFTRVSGVNYNLHQPQTLSPLPPEPFLEKWRDDYNVMLEQMIYEQDAPSFDMILADISILTNSINALSWKMSTVFSFNEQDQ